MVRPDTFNEVRAHLAGLSDAELERLFWKLTDEVVEPLVDLARTHTSPSIERSVLMRMGIDSLRCQAIVGECEKRRLLGHGAGHVVLAVMSQLGCTAPEAASRLADGEGWEIAEAKWGGQR
jgi:D-ornithine 4,5-aminomutase subunit alpha